MSFYFSSKNYGDVILTCKLECERLSEDVTYINFTSSLVSLLFTANTLRILNKSVFVISILTQRTAFVVCVCAYVTVLLSQRINVQMLILAAASLPHPVRNHLMYKISHH